MAATHSLEHLTFVEGCYLCRLRSVSIAPAALPTRRDIRYSSTDQLERNWQRDIPAYRRLVKEGLQPERVDGCADLEAKAESRDEIEGEHFEPIVQETSDAVHA